MIDDDDDAGSVAFLYLIWGYGLNKTVRISRNDGGDAGSITAVVTAVFVFVVVVVTAIIMEECRGAKPRGGTSEKDKKLHIVRHNCNGQCTLHHNTEYRIRMSTTKPRSITKNRHQQACLQQKKRCQPPTPTTESFCTLDACLVVRHALASPTNPMVSNVESTTYTR